MPEQAKDVLLDTLPILISIIALISSVLIGRRQVKISQMQTDFQNKVELYLVLGLCQVQGSLSPLPAIYVKNAGNSVVYLTKYDLNGNEVPQNKFVLPPMSMCNEAYYCIQLPIDGTLHFSFKLKFKDWQQQKWRTEGYVDYKNGQWELTYSPCERKTDDR